MQTVHTVTMMTDDIDLYFEFTVNLGWMNVSHFINNHFSTVVTDGILITVFRDTLYVFFVSWIKLLD